MAKQTGFSARPDFTSRHLLEQGEHVEFSRAVELDPYSFETASLGRNAASLVDSLSRRSKRMSMKDLRYD